MQRAQVHQRRKPLRAGHVEIEQQQVGIGFGFGQRIERLDVLGFAQLHVGQHPLHRATQGFAEQRVVVGDEDGRAHRLLSQARAAA